MVLILKDLISGTLNDLEQNIYLKILIGCVWENSRRKRGVSCPPSLSTIEKSTSPLNFQTNVPFFEVSATTSSKRSALV